METNINSKFCFTSNCGIPSVAISIKFFFSECMHFKVQIVFNGTVRTESTKQSGTRFYLYSKIMYDVPDVLMYEIHWEVQHCFLAEVLPGLSEKRFTREEKTLKSITNVVCWELMMKFCRKSNVKNKKSKYEMVQLLCWVIDKW